MAYFLITVENKSDADAIANAFVNRFRNYTVHISQLEEMSFVKGYKLTAEYISPPVIHNTNHDRLVDTTARKRETNPQVNLNTAVFSEFAYAFYMGLIEGSIQARQEG